MTVVIDSSVLIDHLRGDSRTRSALQRVLRSDERVVGSVLSRIEVLAGMRVGEEIATSHLLALLEWISVDEGVADEAGALARRYLRSHPGIDPVDYVIAASTALLDAELWTRNTKHFPMVDRVWNPADPTRSL